MIEKLFEIAQLETNTWPPLVRNAKLMEEVGEFSEALLHKLGHLPHKTMKEPIEGEAADIILCVIDTLASVYPDLTPTELTELLQERLTKKSQKWIEVAAMLVEAPARQAMSFVPWSKEAEMIEAWGAPSASQPLTPNEIAKFVGTHEFGPEQLKWFRFGEAAHGINGREAAPSANRPLTPNEIAEFVGTRDK